MPAPTILPVSCRKGGNNPFRYPVEPTNLAEVRTAAYGQHVLIFVHGYNTADAMPRLKDIRRELGTRFGLYIPFAWPGSKIAAAFHAAMLRTDESALELRKVLTACVDGGALSITLVGHSAGCHVIRQLPVDEKLLRLLWVELWQGATPAPIGCGEWICQPYNVATFSKRDKALKAYRASTFWRLFKGAGLHTALGSVGPQPDPGVSDHRPLLRGEELTDIAPGHSDCFNELALARFRSRVDVQRGYAAAAGGAL